MSTDNYDQIYDDEGYALEFPVFTAEVVEKIENGPGCWHGVKVGVFQQDVKDGEKKLLGTYNRNYSTNFRDFAVTRKDGRYFALYSPDYTSTRVMEITPGVGFTDIGGESRDKDGFCPVDFYVPTLREYVNEHNVGPTSKIKDWSCLLDYFPPGSRKTEMHKQKDRQQLQYPDGKRIEAYTNPDKPDIHKWVYGPERDYESGFVILPPLHGFVAGCYWGDDSSWKIQYLDVSRIDEGIIKRDERFGYITLPTHLTLKQAVKIDDLMETGGRIRMSIELDWEIESGGILDWDNLAKAIAKGQPKIDAHEAASGEWDLQGDREDMRRRWAEQGEQILADMALVGGLIR